MRICMLLRKTFPADVRVEKEARALRAAGHEVVVLCREYGDRPAHERIEGIEVRRANPQQQPGSRRRASFRYLVGTVHPFWREALAGVVREEAIDAIHVHDLPLVATGCRVGENHGIPVIADCHENYPEAIRQWRRMDDLGEAIATPSKLAERALRPVWRWKRIERTSLARADRVLTVCVEAREHYESDCGLASEKILEVSNTVDLDRFDALLDGTTVGHRADEGVVDRPVGGRAGTDTDAEDAFVLTYVGKFAPHRGLETVIRALPALREEGVNPQLRLVGEPGIATYGERLAALCRELGVADRIEVTGWVDFEEVPKYMAESDVCVVTHAATPHTETTVPHKLFQYMAAGTPVLVSNVAPLQRVVTDGEAGLVVPAGDHRAAAAALRTLHEEPERAREMGENGRRAVEKRYHWGVDGARLQALYDDLEDIPTDVSPSRSVRTAPAHHTTVEPPADD